MDNENELKEIKLKIGVDSYKALQNYIHNELKITKPEIEEMIERVIERIVDKKLSSDEFMNTHVDRVVRKSISRINDNGRYNIEQNIDSAIERAIGSRIMETVKQRLGNIAVRVEEVKE